MSLFNDNYEHHKNQIHTNLPIPHRTISKHTYYYNIIFIWFDVSFDRSDISTHKNDCYCCMF